MAAGDALVHVRWAELLGRLADAERDGARSPRGDAVLDIALANFRRGGADLLDRATPWLWLYYLDVVGEYTLEQRREWGLPELADGADIWAEVTLPSPPVLYLGGTPLQPEPAYLGLEGEVSWEPEHGLLLVFDNGERLGKVGPYDGHLTVAAAYNSVTRLGEVYG